MDSVQDTRRKNWGWFYYDLVDQWGEIIKADGLAVMMVLIRHADNESGQCFPSTATIAKKTGLSRRHVVSTLQLLAQHGLISKTARSITTAEGTTSHQSNIYTLLPLPGVMHTMHKGTAQDAQGVMQAVQGGYAQDAHKQDPMNKTQKKERDAAPPSAQMPYPANPPAIATGDMDRDPEWDAVGESRAKQIRPGTPIQLRPDRPAVTPVPKAGDDPALDSDWQTLVATFPHRDGPGRVHRPKDTRLAFTLAGPGKRAAILTGARHLAAGSKDAQEGFGPHLLDFIQQETYTLWQTPAPPRPIRPTSDPHRPPSPPRRLLNPPQATSA